ncbi:hypothetical protein Tco_1438195 [Tanacetum coccineum]
MAAIKYRDEHNKVGFLEKPKGSDDYHQILDFLRGSHIRYALTHDPIIYDSLVKQFWSTASLRASKEGPPAILATIDRTPYTITESLVRSQLQLDDEGGVEDLPIAEIYLGSWDQFGSQLAIAIICLTEGRRFLQMILEIEPKNTKQYHAFKLTSKMFANMRLNFQGNHMPLMGTMLPPPQAAIAGESSGEDVPSNPQTVPATITDPDHSHDHESTPPRPTTTIPAGAPVNEQGPSSDPNIASSTRPHESAPDLFTSTNVEDDTMGGSFHSSPPRSTQAPPEGTTSGGAEDLDKLTALSSLVSTLVQKVNSQESDLQAHKLLFKEVVGKLVKRVKLLEDKLKGRKRKVVLTDSDKEEDAELNVDPLIKLAQAAATAAAASVVPTDGFHEAEIPPSSSVPTDDSAGGSEIPAGATTGPSTVYPSSTTVPTTSSVPAAAPIPAGSGTTSASPSSPERDARKGKGIAVDTPSPTQHKTFKQLEEERLGWEAAEKLQAQELADFEKQRAESLLKDANLARQMSQDFDMTEAQRKRQQEVLASAANYSDAAWDIILARLQANPDLSSTIFGVEFNDDDFAARMVELVNTRRKELAEQRAQERRDRPMTPSQLRQYMRTYVKNQGPAVYSTGWTMAQVQKLTPEQLQEEFDKIQRAVAFTRGVKRDGSPKARASSKKLKTGDDDVNLVATSHGNPQEEAGATPSPNVSQEEVAAPSHSKDIPDAPVKAPSTTASTAQHTGSSPKKVGTRKKRLGRKGAHSSHSTIPIEDGDPEAEHKLCIKYASDADSASDDDTPVNLFVVVDWELLPTGLGWINVFYRKDNSRKCFTSLWEILHLVTRADLMTIYGRVMTFYQDKQAEGVGLVLWGDLKVLIDSPEVNDGSEVWKHQNTWNIQSWKLYSYSGVHVLEIVGGLVIHMSVDKKYPLSVNLIEQMLDHQLEICQDTVGNELTTAVQLIVFLKKQIADSRRPKVHDFLGCPNYLDPNSSCDYFRWVDGELPSQWYQRRMYILHVNPRTAQDVLRTAQDELVQVNVERGRVAFFNKMLMLLVLAMFLISPVPGIAGVGTVGEAGTVGEGSSIGSCDATGYVLVIGISSTHNGSSGVPSFGQAGNVIPCIFCIQSKKKAKHNHPLPLPHHPLPIADPSPSLALTSLSHAYLHTTTSLVRGHMRWELEELIKDQLLPADASPIALSSDYISDSDPEEDDEEDPEEDPADYPADGGDNDDKESSDDDNDDDDVRG